MKDVPGGAVSSRPTSLHGRRHEHQGSVPGVRSAQRHRSQDARVLGAARIPKTQASQKAQDRSIHRVIDRILEDDLSLPRKQRHTAKRIYDRLRDEYGFDGRYTIVKDYVRERRLRTREMFVPLVHPPGHAQCDFGEAWAVIGGVKRKVHFFVLDLPHSDAMFARAYPAETTEAFCDGHVSAFSFLGGVPQSIVYDNTRLAVARILGDGRRQRTRVFTELQSHYLFEDRFGRPGKGNDKGKVESMVGYTRRNFLVPIPSFDSFEALNAHLEERCLDRMEAKLRGHTETIGERMVRDLDALLPLPAVPYDPSDRHLTRVSSLSLVRYRTNDYSVPVAYGHREVLVRGYVDRVVISCGTEVIARHRRSYDRDDFVFDPLPASAGTQDRCAGPGGATCRMGPPRGVRHPAPAAGVSDGQTRQERVRAGAQTHGDVQSRGGPCCRAGRDQAGSAELRRGQAPRAVRHRGTTAKTGPGSVPVPAQGEREHYFRHRLHDASVREGIVSDRPTILLEHHLRELRLPTFLREYGKMAAQCAAEGVGHPDYLLRLSELELIDRHHRMVERRIRAARFPTVKSLDTFDFLAIPSVNRQLVTHLARCEYVDRRENIIAIGNSGTGKTHMALGLGLAACQRGLSVGFTTAAALVNELMEARDDRRLLNFQKRLSRLKLLIIDELGFVPLSKTGAELLFEVFSQRYERGSVLVTTNLPFDEWTDVFGSERLTSALLDRLTHHVHILAMNGESYRLKQSRQTATAPSSH